MQATERFEAVYPVLKEVALAGAPGSKAMKQVTLQIFGFAILAAGEGNAFLLQSSLAFLYKHAFVRCRDIYEFVMCTNFAGKPELAKEATDITVWCLAQNSDIYKQWVK